MPSPTDAEPTAVILRRWPEHEGGGVIALFPEIPSDRLGVMCLSYMRVGQHSGADCQGVIDNTKPVTSGSDDAANFMQHLRSIGYDNLQHVARCSHRHHERRRTVAKEQRDACRTD